MGGASTAADDGKHAGSFSFACEELVAGAWRLRRGEFEGGGSRQGAGQLGI